MSLVQDKGKMRISYAQLKERAILFKHAKNYKQKNTALPILLTRQVVSAISTDAEFPGNEKY